MRLEDYWGVGPKTRDRLDAELGTEAAVEAIEGADVGPLVGAGLSRGRATAILRRATGGEGMDVLATRDATAVYKDLLGMAAEHAVTEHTADRIRVLTPLREREQMEARLDDVTEAMDSWRDLDDATGAAVLDAVDGYDGSDRAAVDAALELRETDATGGVFRAVFDLDVAGLRAAADALATLDDDGVGEGADAELDRLRESLDAVERMEGSAFDVLEDIREEGVRGEAELRSAVVGYLDRETPVNPDAIRRAAPDEAADAADFVGATLRGLREELDRNVAEREATIVDDLEAAIGDAREDVDAAVDAIDRLTLYLSLARFALAFDLSRPTFVDDGLAVRNARNLSLATGENPVQPVDYGVGEHSIAASPSGDRVAVLTGANSGGKTTLLETLCQVSLLAMMGLPVPAEVAQVCVVDSLVFHRRHASFNAGVLESTLKSIVPPLVGEDRTLMLVDEFEAITEPGRAADLLHGLVTLTVERSALGAFVTHLAEDLEPLPPEGRVDGIFAEGLSADLELVVDYQPRFGELGRSTPEFIVSRLIADARDRETRAGFEHLAGALGEELAQRTLTDARWGERPS